MSARRAGPKAAITAEPLDFSEYAEDRAQRRLRFIDEYLVVPRGHGAGEPVRLREFQREVVEGAFAPGVRTAVVSIPRANGKTALAAMLALAEMFTGPPSAEVLVVATDQRQAEVTMRLARRMVELNPILAERMHVFRDRLYLPHNDAALIPLPADPAALHGHDPSLLIIDELHVVTREVWEAAASVGGKREESLTFAISTPSTSPDCVMWSLVEHGRERDDPGFYLCEFAAPDGCGIDDRQAWRVANPALSDPEPFLAEDAMDAVMKTLREPVFRQLRLGQWVTGSEAWLPFGAWRELAAPREVGRREKVVLGFDGSASGDSTALIGCTLGDRPYVWVEGLWEAPVPYRAGWRVPRGEVDQAVADAFATYNVVELAADPWGWRSEVEAWQKRHGERRVTEYNTGFAARMAPATDRVYQLVVAGEVSHDGDEDLASHFDHCVARPTANGDLVSKDKRNSPRKIDAAVGAIIAVDRAAYHTNKPKRALSFAS